MESLKKRPEPIIKLEDDEMRILTEILIRIKNCLKKTDHTFQSATTQARYEHQNGGWRPEFWRPVVIREVFQKTNGNDADGI